MKHINIDMKLNDIKLERYTKMKLTKRADMLMNNNLDWYVVTVKKDDYENTYELKHHSDLSSIIDCGHNPKDYGYDNVEQCWNGEDCTTEGDWE